MSKFAGKTVKELKQLCQSRGLSFKGLRKAQLVQLLLDSDNEPSMVSVNAASVHLNDTDAVEQGHKTNAYDDDDDDNEVNNSDVDIDDEKTFTCC